MRETDQSLDILHAEIAALRLANEALENRMLADAEQTEAMLGELESQRNSLRTAQTTQQSLSSFIQRVMDSAGSLLVVLAPDGRVRMSNLRCEGALGAAASALAGTVLDDLLPAEERAAVAAQLPALPWVVHSPLFELISSQGSYRAEHRLLAGDGGYRSYLFEATTLHNPQGKLEGAVVSATDITERKQAEEALKTSEERWKFALEGANDGVWDWNYPTSEILFSSRWKAMFGYAEADVENTVTAWLGRIHPDDLLDAVTAIRQHLFDMSPPFSVEYRIRCKDGSWKWTLGRGMVFTRDANGKPLRLVGTNTDISERKLIEDQMASLLDNSGQGFLSFGADLLIAPQYSLACETMLGRSPAGRNAADVFFHDDLVKAELFRATIPAALSEPDDGIRESMLSLLPTDIQRDDRLLKAEYKALDNGTFMVVLTDITVERRMAAQLDSEQRRLELIVRAVSDSRNFFDSINAFREFLAEGLPSLLTGMLAPHVLARELYRDIHTYKGLLNQFGFPSTPTALHALEGRMSALVLLGDTLTRQQITELVSPDLLRAPFDADLAILSDALGDDFLAHGESIILSAGQARQLEQLATRLLRGESVDASVAEVRSLLSEIVSLRQVSFQDALMSYDGLVRQAAERLEKQVAPIVVQGGADVWIDPEALRAFLRSLVHVFRNAVAHGIETPDVRWAAGKAEAGTITCRVSAADDTITLSIADDGGGIDLEALRQRAVEMGLYGARDVLTVSDEDIARLVFRDNISTQHEVTELAGRGVGLAAVLNETEQLGGEVVVKTTAGHGTEFRFTLRRSPRHPSETISSCPTNN